MNSKIKRININDQEYPSLLRIIPNPPRNLFVKGNFLPNNNCFAIVGARNYTQKGKEKTQQITKKLSKRFTIVSGLASGIDTITHSSTLKEKERTFAVLPAGINQIYPQKNKRLANQIIKNNGCLISEYSPQTKLSKKQFLERNRITAGLSSAILAVNARKRSGTSSTIRKALKQKKKVFTIDSDSFPNTIKIKNTKDILKNL